MNPLKSAKNFVVRHKTRLLVTTTVLSVTTVAVMKVGLNQHNEFLKAEGLFDKFYLLGDFAEK